MKLTKILPLALGLMMAQGIQAQQDPIVMQIGDQQIRQSEFMKEFRRSIGQDPKAAPTACTYEKRQALEEYVELFANYRAKVMDAEALQLDTLRSFKRELGQYRQELREPYLIDSVTLDRIMREAYDRNHYAVHAAHILVKLPQDPSPADTLAAYNKALELRQRVLAGEDFGELAVRYSDDHSAQDDINTRRPGNKGDLGFFTVFQMVYPFETAAYTLEPGQISMPVRSNYGYHVVKLIDRVPYFGKVTLQHIWISNRTTPGEGGSRLASDAYARLQEGVNFAQVAKNYSSDRAENGSLVSNLDLGQMPAEYVKAISTLKDGEYSQPFESSMGWHIVKLVKGETIPPYEDMVPLYRQRLSRDSRSAGPKEAFALQCRQKYGFRDFTQERVPAKKGAKPQYKASLAECYAAVTDSIFHKKWHYADSMVSDLRPLFELGGKPYTAADFLRFMEETAVWQPGVHDTRTYVDKQYKRFIDSRSVAMADSLLEQENADFRDLMQEYRNGLLIFAYNDRMVWSKAIADTAGLQQFYLRESAKRSIDNPEDEPYFWRSRAHVLNIVVADSALLSPKKAKKVIDKCLKQGFNTSATEKMLMRAVKGTVDSGVVAVSIKEQLIEEGTSDLLTKSEWKRGTYDRPARKGYSLLVVDYILNPEHKTVREARGYYINDYQNYLDQELIKSLRQKYNVKIHQNVVDEITY